MDANLQSARNVLDAIKGAIERLDDWGYALVLRFGVVDRHPAEARMLKGGNFVVACSFAIDRPAQRWLNFAITVEWAEGEWVVQALAEDDGEAGTNFLWKSERWPAATSAEFDAGLQRALGALAGSIEVPAVANVLASMGRKRQA